MKKIVLDASALLALFNKEPGYLYVEEKLPYVLISSVNLSEVLTVMIDKLGIPAEEARQLTDNTLDEIIDFDSEQAFIAATLRNDTKTQGLSFGARACLALAKTKNLTVFTADKAWEKLKINIDIQLIR